MNYFHPYSNPPQIVIGQEYGLTPYSEFPIRWYESQRNVRQKLNAGEYYAVTQGYLREWVCMGQCNLYIQAAKNPEIKKAIEIYRHDVCEPNLTELKVILEQGNYKLPAEYNAITQSKSVLELGTIPTTVIDDRQILIGFIFSTQAFMNLWNMGATHCYRAEVRDAFLRNYHRANRWHLAFRAMAEQMGLKDPQPIIQ
jgi:lipopolysaccharide biosynthesis glycosyltransferase